MLNKEECEKALENLRILERKDNFEKYNQVAPQVNCDVFGQLIEEYFKLVSKYKKLQKVNEKQANIIRENAFFHVSHNWLEPYKFEDLKVGMWVWYKPFKDCRKIREVSDNDKKFKWVEFEDGFVIEYEESQFFPVTKLQEY